MLQGENLFIENTKLIIYIYIYINKQFNTSKIKFSYEKTLCYKEPCWKYTFPISHAHPRNLHFILLNCFTFVISLTLLSLLFFFLSHRCSLLSPLLLLLLLPLLLLFLTHTACLFFIRFIRKNLFGTHVQLYPRSVRHGCGYQIAAPVLPRRL